METTTKSLTDYKRKIAQLKNSLHKAGQDFQLGKVTELDNQVKLLLSKLNERPKLPVLLASELRGLYLAHQQLLKQCQSNCERLKKNMQQHQQNKEGLMAYQTIGAGS